MSVLNTYKLKSLLQQWSDSTVATAEWLESIGVSKQLRLRYQKSGWITLLSRGAFKKAGKTIDWQGAIYAIQKQSKLDILPSALTAISLQGGTHYIRMDRENLYLFAPKHTILPQWFKNYDWNVNVKFYSNSFLPFNIGLKEYAVKDFTIQISSLERAILECLYLVPDKMDLVECYHIMEGLTTLRPFLLQELLEKCSSIKVTRLFLYMAEKTNHAWFKHLAIEKFNTGKGERSLVKNGTYIPKYKITIPRELAQL